MSVCVCLCQLVPLLKLLYHAPNDSSHHLSYMALIVILILTLSVYVCLCVSVSVGSSTEATLSCS